MHNFDAYIPISFKTALASGVTIEYFCDK